MEENQQAPQTPSFAGPPTLPGSPEALSPVPATGKNKKLIIGAALVLAAVLLGGGYYAYAWYSAPARVWQKYISHLTVSSPVSETFSSSYVDNGKISGQAASNPMAGVFNNLKFAVDGTAYVNAADPAKPEAIMDFNYSFGAGDTSISSKAHLILINGDTYINPGNNPVVNSMMALLSSGEKVEWIKISPQELQQATQAMNASTSPVAPVDFAAQVKDYQNLFEKYLPKVLLINKVLGRETIRGVSTIHYSNKVDAGQLNALTGELFNKMLAQMAAEGQSKPEDLAQAKIFMTKMADVFVAKAKAGTIETWIGANDYQIHKFKLISNAPSIISLFSAAANNPDLSSGPDKAAATILDSMTFDGQFSIDEEIYDYGKTMAVKAPDKSFDLAKKIKDQMQTPPATLVPNPALKQ